ncbi:MAG: HdeD family acid-resistance protein [Faecousia sp.]
MGKIKENFGGIITCIAEALVGILLLVNPVRFTQGIIIALGAIFFVSGIINVIRYFRTEAAQAVLGQQLVKGMLGIICGVFCILNSEWFVATFPVLTILYGIANLIVGLFKVEFTVDAIRCKSRWGWAAFSAVVTLLFAVIILLNPFRSTIVLWTFTAVTLILEAVFDLIVLIIITRKKEQASKQQS